MLCSWRGRCPTQAIMLPVSSCGLEKQTTNSTFSLISAVFGTWQNAAQVMLCLQKKTGFSSALGALQSLQKKLSPAERAASKPTGFSLPAPPRGVFRSGCGSLPAQAVEYKLWCPLLQSSCAQRPAALRWQHFELLKMLFVLSIPFKKTPLLTHENLILNGKACSAPKVKPAVLQRWIKQQSTQLQAGFPRRGFGNQSPSALLSRAARFCKGTSESGSWYKLLQMGI